MGGGGGAAVGWGVVWAGGSARGQATGEKVAESGGGSVATLAIAAPEPSFFSWREREGQQGAVACPGVSQR